MWGRSVKKTTLTKGQFKHVKAAFRAFSGPDALIDYPEWKTALGLRNDLLVRRIFDLVDADGTGFIDLDEFVAFAGNLCSDDPRRRLDFIFRIYDLDGDGAISRQEFREVLEASLAEQSMRLDEEVVKAMTARLMARTDLDKDGAVSPAEFAEAMGGYPGLSEQFSVYAADWLNEGMEFRPRKVQAAPLRTRLKRFWQNRGCAWLWSLAYAAANTLLFAEAVHRYWARGADPLVQVARGAGACLNFNGAFILLPACRALWTAVRRTRFDRFFPLDGMTAIHRAAGRALVLFAAIHVAAHLAHDRRAGTALAPVLFRTSVGLSGLAAAALLAFIGATAWWAAGRKRERFAAAHLLYGAWLAALLLHGPRFWAWLLLPAGLFLGDALARWGINTRRTSVLGMKPLSDGVTWLRLKKPRGFMFQPGDFLYLNVPAISPGEWHPFTISAAPEAEEIGVHVRINGDWTGALHNLSRKKSSVGKKWPARIDGPYGAPSSRISRARVAVLVAGGIGATPFASVLQSLLLRRDGDRRQEEGGGQVVHFHWLNRSHRSYEWFVDLLREAEQKLGDRFRLNIHLTSLTHDLTNIAMQVAMDAYHERHRRDPVTGLRAVTSAGRPDWDALFRALVLEHPGERVEVFFCGPPGLGKVVEKNCRKHGFIFHKEKF